MPYNRPIDNTLDLEVNTVEELEGNDLRFFRYGAAELAYLKSKDKILGIAIEEIGAIQRPIIPNPFVGLISSIVSQQISKKAAQTVWNRFVRLVGSVKPETIAKTDLAAIQACGMSTRKAGYILGVAQAALAGEVDFASFPALSDEKIISLLSALPGVGIWTAEMLLIFSLCRPDVLSYHDLAIRRGMMNLYGYRELPRKTFEKHRRIYSPHCSVASLYLWELSHQ